MLQNLTGSLQHILSEASALAAGICQLSLARHTMIEYVMDL